MVRQILEVNGWEVVWSRQGMTVASNEWFTIVIVEDNDKYTVNSAWGRGTHETLEELRNALGGKF